MSYHISAGEFSGPLDLLLQLIEKEELDITTISLAQVTDEYLRHVRSGQQIDPYQMADFLLVAAKLMLLKSKALLPHLQVEEEEDVGDLEKQLKLYKEFAAASVELEKMIAQQQFSHSREKLPVGIAPEFHPPKKLTVDTMRDLFAAVIARLEPVVHLPERIVEKVVSIEEKIDHLRSVIKTAAETTFHSVVARGNKGDTIVSFLALLELVKQRVVELDQDELFTDITIRNKQSV